MTNDDLRRSRPLTAVMAGVVAGFAAISIACAQDDAVLWTYDSGG